tara:strand:- start:41 stop:490 length:450 start_codon:yes stop_codon:yes gene_type:complete
MKIDIQVKNINEALKKFDTLKKDLETPFREVIAGGAQLIRGQAIRSIQTGPKSGRIYEKYNPRRTHRSSAPGQAPASDTGNLVSQIRVREENKDLIKVESNALYSSFLEFGTSKMLARPFLFPASERSRPKIAQAVFNRVVKEIKRLVK